MITISSISIRRPQDHYGAPGNENPQGSKYRFLPWRPTICDRYFPGLFLSR